MSTNLSIEEGVIKIPPYRKPVYKIDVTDVGTSSGTVTSEGMTIKEDGPLGTDVSSTVLTGSSSISGQEITLKKIQGDQMTLGKKYWVLVTFTKDSSEEGVELWAECAYELEDTE